MNSIPALHDRLAADSVAAAIAVSNAYLESLLKQVRMNTRFKEEISLAGRPELGIQYTVNQLGSFRLTHVSSSDVGDSIVATLDGFNFHVFLREIHQSEDATKRDLAEFDFTVNNLTGLLHVSQDESAALQIRFDPADVEKAVVVPPPTGNPTPTQQRKASPLVTAPDKIESNYHSLVKYIEFNTKDLVAEAVARLLPLPTLGRATGALVFRPPHILKWMEGYVVVVPTTVDVDSDKVECPPKRAATLLRWPASLGRVEVKLDFRPTPPNPEDARVAVFLDEATLGSLARQVPVPAFKRGYRHSTVLYSYGYEAGVTVPPPGVLVDIDTRGATAHASARVYGSADASFLGRCLGPEVSASLRGFVDIKARFAVEFDGRDFFLTAQPESVDPIVEFETRGLLPFPLNEVAQDLLDGVFESVVAVYANKQIDGWRYPVFESHLMNSPFAVPNCGMLNLRDGSIVLSFP